MRRALFVLSFASCAMACSAHSSTPPTTTDETTLLAQDGTDANEVESQASLLTAALTLAAGQSSPTAEHLVAAAQLTPDEFMGGCLDVAADPTNQRVTYTLRSCSGVWGLARISGTLVAAYTNTANGVQIDVGGAPDGKDAATVEFARATATYQATAVVTAPSSVKRSMTWTGALQGTTARGRSFMRTASWTMGWTIGDRQSCISLDGTAEGDVEARKLLTDVSGYQRCKLQCPSQGTVKVTNEATQKVVTLVYDGSNTATFTGADGKTSQITLACGL